MSREVPLHNRKGEVVAVALVDDADYELVSQHSWHLYQNVERNSGPYARTTLMPGRRNVTMHTFLTGRKLVDHANRNGLDNQRHNLRDATVAQNNINRSGWGKSRFPGVSWHGQAGKWRARVGVNGSRRSLGLFDTEEEAYAARCRAAVSIYGEFANA